MVEYHFKVSPIVYEYAAEQANLTEGQRMFIIKSIKRDNESYNVLYDNSKWSCDCKSYKYKSGVTEEGYCKHIRLLVFFLKEGVVIPFV